MPNAQLMPRATTRSRVGVGDVTSCGDLDLSKTGLSTADQKKFQSQCSSSTSKQGAQQRMDNAGNDFQTLSDYVQHPPNYATMTHDQIMASDQAFLHSFGQVVAIGLDVAVGPVAGGLFAMSFDWVAKGVGKVLDFLGFYNPLPLSSRAIAENPCDPSSADFASFWPNGLPDGPSDPRWIRDPALASAQNQGGYTDLNFAIGPLNWKNWSRWSPSLVMGKGKFEDTAFALLVQNAINSFNCKPAWTSNALLDQIVATWNATHLGPKRAIIISGDVGPVGDNGLPQRTDLWDPITQAWRLGRFDWSAWQKDGQPHWLSFLGDVIQINDGPPLTAKKGMSTATKVAIGTAAVAGLGLAGAGVYAYATHTPYLTVLGRAWQKSGGRAVTWVRRKV